MADKPFPADRAERRAQALRDNLRKRKAQSRAVERVVEGEAGSAAEAPPLSPTSQKR